MASYDTMIKNLRASNPDQVEFINDQLKWAKSTLRKDERIVWWMKFVMKEYYQHDYQKMVSELMQCQSQKTQDYQFGKKNIREIVDDLSRFNTDWDRYLSEKKRIESPLPIQDGDYPLIEFDDGSSWWFLDRAHCEAESLSGQHCGNGIGKELPDQRLLSYRVNGRAMMTFILNPGGFLREMKSYKNQTPPKKYHPFIKELLLNPIITGLKLTQFLPDNSFSVFDLPEDDIQSIDQQKPSLIIDQLGTSPLQSINAPRFIREKYHDQIIHMNKGIGCLIKPDGTLDDSNEAWHEAITINKSLSLIVAKDKIDEYKNTICRVLTREPTLLVSMATRDIRHNFDILKKFVITSPDKIGYIRVTTPRYNELVEIRSSVFGDK